jgi:hypothetical protein
MAIRTSTLHPDGTETNVRFLEQDAIRRCRFLILLPDHYRDDGTCKCDDPAHRALMIREHGYKSGDFDGIRLRSFALVEGAAFAPLEPEEDA